MKHRILAIEDEIPWQENYSAWILEALAALDPATTTEQAVKLLRRRRYDAVILDLSMDNKDASNRSNQGIQDYLSSKPEGTQYIIVSRTIQKTELRNAAFHLNAFGVIFKDEIDSTILRDKLAGAIDESQRHQASLVADARGRLTQGGRLEGAMLESLHPKDGAKNLYPLIDMLLSRIAPVVAHRNRPSFVAHGQHILGLVWSRQLGTAVSIAMSSTKASKEESTDVLAEWLGHKERGRDILDKESSRVRLLMFEEPNVTDVHFDLPDIHV